MEQSERETKREETWMSTWYSTREDHNKVGELRLLEQYAQLGGVRYHLLHTQTGGKTMEYCLESASYSALVHIHSPLRSPPISELRFLLQYAHLGGRHKTGGKTVEIV